MSVLPPVFDGDEAGTAKMIKCHRTTLKESVAADAWQDCDGFTEFADESQGGALSLSTDGISVNVVESGQYQFGGCMHIQNNTAGIFSGVKVLGRLTQDGNEMRCSQRGYTRDIAAGGEDILSFNGTAKLAAGEAVKMQYFVSDSDVNFYNSSDFTNQIAYTMWLVRIGDTG